MAASYELGDSLAQQELTPSNLLNKTAGQTLQ